LWLKVLGWIGIGRLLNAFHSSSVESFTRAREDDLMGMACGCGKKWLKDNGFSPVSFPTHPPSSD